MLPALSQHLQEINFIETVKKRAVFRSLAMCIIQATVRSRQKYICCICRRDSHVICWFMRSGFNLWLPWLKLSSFRHLMFLNDKTLNTKSRVVVTWNEFSCIFWLPRSSPCHRSHQIVCSHSETVKDWIDTGMIPTLDFSKLCCHSPKWKHNSRTLQEAPVAVVHIIPTQHTMLPPLGYQSSIFRHSS